MTAQRHRVNPIIELNPTTKSQTGSHFSISDNQRTPSVLGFRIGKVKIRSWTPGKRPRVRYEPRVLTTTWGQIRAPDSVNPLPVAGRGCPRVGRQAFWTDPTSRKLGDRCATKRHVSQFCALSLCRNFGYLKVFGN
jgi:hypothetical protein